MRGWKNTNKRQTRCERKKKRQNKMPKKNRGNKRITRNLFKKKQTPEKP